MQIWQIVLIIFTAVSSIGVVIQAGVLLGFYIASRKAAREAQLLSEQLKQHLVPALATTRNLVEDLSPKLKTAASNLVETSRILRAKTDEVCQALTQVSHTAEHQAARVDQMATAIFDGINQATAAVQHGIATPLKQVSGVLNGLKAGIDVLRNKERPMHVDGDGGNFV